MNTRAQVPDAVKIPNPVELPSPSRRPPQLAGYAFTLDQAVDWFFKQNPEIRSAREKLERMYIFNAQGKVPETAIIRVELELADVTRRGLLELKTSFYQAVLARLLIYEAEENLTYLDNYINRMQARYEEAVAPESEVTKWRLERARVTDAIAEAKLAERQARIKFFLLLGYAGSTVQGALRIYFEEPPTAPMKFTVEDLVEIGLRERLDLQAAESLARLAKKAPGKKPATETRTDSQPEKSRGDNTTHPNLRGDRIFLCCRRSTSRTCRRNQIPADRAIGIPAWCRGFVLQRERGAARHIA
jgi:hypothetical protein